MADVKVRQGYYITLQKLLVVVNKFDATTPLSDIESHIEKADNSWKKLEDAHNKILAITADADIEVQMDALEPMDSCYMKIKGVLYRLRASIPTAAPKASVLHPTGTFKLPDISAPTFEGKFEDWPTFSDTFKNAVHNNSSLSGAQKLQYLKTMTKGEASNLIKSFSVTHQNYVEAWALLEQRYNNEREIIHSHIKKLVFQQSIRNESVQALEQLLNTTMESLRCLKALKRPTDTWDDIVTVIVTEKLDPESKAEWAKTLTSTAPPTLKDVETFIEQHIRTLRARGPSRSQQQTGRSQGQAKQINNHHTSFNNSSCPVCSESHPLFMCSSFKQMTPEKRNAVVKSSNLCWNCLKPGHSSKECSSKHTCKTCGKKHNTLLHIDNQPAAKRMKVNNMTITTPEPSSSSTASVSAESSSQSATMRINTNTMVLSPVRTLLKTALVDIVNIYGEKVQYRALIDEGGEGSLITTKTMNLLGVKKYKADVIVGGVGETVVTHSKWKVCIRVFSQINDCFIDVELYAVDKITGKLPKLPQGTELAWDHIKNLKLADPYYQEGGEQDILLGMDVAPYIFTGERISAGRDKPVAQNSIFGWVLGGNVGDKTTTATTTIRTHLVMCHLSEAVKKFWEIEEVPTAAVMSEEERECEEHFVNHHQRLEDGRYMVRLPFNSNKTKLGTTREQALFRLHQLERRFQRFPEKKHEYIKFMREYENLQHMKKVPVTHQSIYPPVYLPHHFVLKEESTTTKQRTVFDGSAKSSTGISLNAALLVGATVQPDLFTLILRFRLFIIALKADIEKMFRQFGVKLEDQDFQRILWREDPSHPIQEYHLTTVTYGTGCASFLATRCLVQLAIDEEKNFPLVSKAIRTSMYMDDYLGGGETVEEAEQLVKEIRGIAAAAGMEIRKWCSNKPQVLQQLPDELREDQSIFEINEGESGSLKALGIKWQPKTDTFGFKVTTTTLSKVTKRSVLSEIAKTFDPLGWLSPVTIRAKLLLQSLWLEGFSWDDKISPENETSWNNYQTDLPLVEQVQNPRCVVTAKVKGYEIHGFSDSSEAAYASATYLKCTYQDGTVSVNLLTSRTKVAPLKTVSLPKLELCGAKLLAETVEAVQKALDLPHQLYCWSDSTITLRWISSPSRKWKTFVANRVATIQTLVPPEHWHHVRSEDNPADLPSRGIHPNELHNNKLWWNGPSWLQHESYPIHQKQADEEEVKKEERKKKITCFHLAFNSTHETLFEAFSSFTKLCRAVVYYLRYIEFHKTKSVKKEAVTTVELGRARIQLIKWSQRARFPDEIHDLKKHGRVGVSSKLVQLNPFLDSDGVLRVGGRIQNARLPEDVKHPIILCNHHQITKLIVLETHLRRLHSGFPMTMAELRRKYWILRGRDIIRSIIRKCVICRRHSAKTATQLMGSLPVGRVNATRPFLHCGVDFAGPFAVKLRKGRHVPVEKAYFAIFICLTTKAVHLESVNNLTTEAFIACLERMAARRGVPAYLYSDNGTNFVGADRVLQQYLEHEQKTIQAGYANRGTQWIFNPPASPHHGGLWEAGVKSVKHHFKRVVGCHVLMLDHFQTLLCKIEACLNSRPLCTLSSDPTDLQALTPGHFLIGEPLTTIPEPDCRLQKENRLSYYELIRQKSQHFWDRWSSEYLTSLQQRFKWMHKRDNLQVGDLVVIRDEQLPQTKWKLGRIISTHMGDDGLVRKVTLKTATGELTRSIAKLCPLISKDEL